MIKLVWNKKDITEYVSTIQWSGAHNGAAREVSFSLLNDPFDARFALSGKIKNSDKIWLMDDKTCLFYGLVVNVQKKSEIGTVDFLARDMLYNLLNSNMSGRWKNHTPEYIARCICNDYKINQGTISNTKYQIKKLIVKDESPYDVIKKAFRKAKKEKTMKDYFVHMDGDKLCVTPRGDVSGVTLKDDECIYESQYEEDASTVVDLVRVINEKGRLVNKVKDQTLIKKWGIIQQTISVDKGKGTKAAKAEITAPERAATISAIGNIKCVSGYKVDIRDKASGLTGTYLIINDTHTWENGVHLMSLDLKMTAIKKNAKSVQIDDLSYNSWTNRKIKCVFFKYYATGNDARGKRRAAGITCAAPASIPFGTKFTYKGKTYKVTDRQPKAKFKGHLYYIGLMVSEEEAKKADKKKWKDETPVTITNPKPQKKKNDTTKSKDDNASSRAKKLVNYALSFRGKCKYVWTAADPPGGKADCSGFVSHCLNHVGCKVGRLDTIGLSKLGEQVAKGKQQAGDIVLFKGTYRAGVSHVGIMVDKNTYVHCSSSEKNVVVANFNTTWVGQHFHSLRRVV